MKKENKLKLNDFKIDNIDTIKNKYKFLKDNGLTTIQKILNNIKYRYF